MGLFGHSDPAAQEEKLLKKEEKHDESAIKHALKEVAAAEKAEHKAAKEHNSSVKAHARAVEQEHKLAAKVNELTHEHDTALSREQKLAQDINLKERHHAEMEQQIAAKKKALEQAQRKHDINDAARSEKLHTLDSTNRAPTTGAPIQPVVGENLAGEGTYGMGQSSAGINNLAR